MEVLKLTRLLGVAMKATDLELTVLLKGDVKVHCSSVIEVTVSLLFYLKTDVKGILL